MKICTVCKTEKNECCFNVRSLSKDGLCSQCKECDQKYAQRPEIKKRRYETFRLYWDSNKKDINRKRSEYRQNNKEKVLADDKRYRDNNKELMLEIRRRYRENHREKLKKSWRLYWLNHKDKILKHTRDRLASDPTYRLRYTVSRSVYHGLISKNGSKAGKSFFKYVDYTLAELKEHIECQFLSTMSWSNYGSFWHLHHIRPQGSFNFRSMDDPSFKECWSLDNLMPLEKPKNQWLGAFFCNGKLTGKIPERKKIYYNKGTTPKSLLDWALEEETRLGIVNVLNNKKEAELCL